jgi:hypothetical protein
MRNILINTLYPPSYEKESSFWIDPDGILIVTKQNLFVPYIYVQW